MFVVQNLSYSESSCKVPYRLGDTVRTGTHAYRMPQASYFKFNRFQRIEPFRENDHVFPEVIKVQRKNNCYSLRDSFLKFINLNHFTKIK